MPSGINEESRGKRHQRSSQTLPNSAEISSLSKKKKRQNYIKKVDCCYLGKIWNADDEVKEREGRKMGVATTPEMKTAMAVLREGSERIHYLKLS